MEKHQWIQGFKASITVCDVNGIVLEMNDAAAKVFASDGGAAMVGKNLYGCHSAASAEKLREMMAAQQENTYTIEKDGVKKIVYQHPWYQSGEFAGFVEISFPLPADMHHFNRD